MLAVAVADGIIGKVDFGHFLFCEFFGVNIREIVRMIFFCQLPVGFPDIVLGSSVIDA